VSKVSKEHISISHFRSF